MTRWTTARGAVRFAGALASLLVVACGGCAGRGGAGDPAAPAAASPAAEQAAEAAVPPAPVVPPELACTTDADCTSSPFARPVAAAAGCYCPTCPVPLAVDAAASHEATWRQSCGAEWEQRAACEAPMCRRPPPVVCRAGACAAAEP